MLSIYLYSFGSVAIVSVISLIGIFTLSISDRVLRKCIFILISFAVGALLGDAFIHLIPEAFDSIKNPIHVSVAVIIGILIFFIFEKFLHWHHHARGEEKEETIHPTGRMIIISDGVHNFIDGLIIAGSYLVSVEVGIATTLAVIFHEIPQEIGDFGVLINAGYSKARALFLNFLSALMALAGALVALAIGTAGATLTIWLIPFAAGGFIYVAMSDLIPELHKTSRTSSSILQLIAVLAGIGAMLLLLLVE